MRSLDEQILLNILTERNMAKAKRAANIKANLPHDKLDRRIEVLNVAIDEHQRMMVEEAE